MSAIDDDATITQLATAWVGVQLGGAKVQEAQYIYQELGDKFNWTVSKAWRDVGCKECVLDIDIDNFSDCETARNKAWKQKTCCYTSGSYVPLVQWLDTGGAAIACCRQWRLFPASDVQIWVVALHIPVYLQCM